MTDDAEPDAVYSCIDRGIQPGGLKRKRKGSRKASKCSKRQKKGSRKAAKGSERQQKAAKDKKKGSRGQQKGND
jgi:hypothetical protein